MYKTFSVNLDIDIYHQVKKLATEKGMPMSKAINAILRAYFKFKRERERNDK